MDCGISKWPVEMFLNMDGHLDPLRWNRRRVFVDWIVESSPELHPPCTVWDLRSFDKMDFIRAESLYELAGLVKEARLAAVKGLFPLIPYRFGSLEFDFMLMLTMERD